MKLIIQIPCYNEETTLPLALKELPRKVKGFKKVEWLIVNDGSEDRTVDVAKQHGVDHIVSYSRNKGLAKAFLAGIDACVRNGADVIVNTDADNQYNAADIPKLVAPILEGKADIVIGARPIGEIAHFSFIKKFLQKAGSAMVRYLSNTPVPDAPSGFRAFSREAAMRLNVFNNYTYTIETIVQAGQKNMAVTSVPIRVNGQLRASRLIRSIPSYIFRTVVTLFRIVVVYKPFRFFMTTGLLVFSAGAFLGIRFLFYYFCGDGAGHIQSLILASVLLGIGFQTILSAFIADLISVNRKLVEEVQYRMKCIECEKGK
ncbi:MAG TPA: glycosyltransferase family 2 protein [Spirochaetota bacterium]|nr:glycosyltransferase family 2 protein [Spirochaetota bacterium]